MPETSALFELLVADVRRQVLFLLCGTESLQVPEGLSARGETQTLQGGQPGPGDQPCPLSDQSVSPESRSLEQLEMELTHVHLPKLEAEGVVEWDRETGTVSRGPGFEEIEPALQLLAANPERLPGELF